MNAQSAFLPKQKIPQGRKKSHSSQCASSRSTMRAYIYMRVYLLKTFFLSSPEGEPSNRPRGKYAHTERRERMRRLIKPARARVRRGSKKTKEQQQQQSSFPLVKDASGSKCAVTTMMMILCLESKRLVLSSADGKGDGCKVACAVSRN